MGIPDYVIEAVSELRAPVGLWLFRNHFTYDWASQEWCFHGPYSKGPKTLAEVREWVERICGWLQYRYPEGPPDELS
ncbi:MAG: hypothetical protein ACHQ2F_03900 [Desulfobaccales bacterium]